MAIEDSFGSKTKFLFIFDKFYECWTQFCKRFRSFSIKSSLSLSFGVYEGLPSGLINLFFFFFFGKTLFGVYEFFMVNSVIVSCV